MQFIGNPHAIEVALLWNVLGKPCTNVLHYDFGSIPTADELNGAGEVALSTFSDLVTGLFAQDSYATGVRVRSLLAADAPQVELMNSPPVRGLNSASTISNNVALCLTLRTALPGRSYRGRIFVPGMPSNHVVGNYADGSYVASVVSAFNGFFSLTLADKTIPLCVYSRRHNGAWRTSGVLTPVTQLSARDNRLDTMRRRLPKV